jgi:hypothetical protein
MARKLWAIPESGDTSGNSAMWGMSAGMRVEGRLPTQSCRKRPAREWPLWNGLQTVESIR